MLIALLVTVAPIIIAVCFVKIFDAIEELKEDKRREAKSKEIIWIYRDGTECSRSDDKKKRICPRYPRR